MAGSSKAVEWRARLRRYEQTGLTVSEFCRREGLSAPSFYAWRRRLARGACRRGRAGANGAGTAGRVAARRGVAGGPAFEQVLLSGGAVVAVLLPSGVRVELPADQVQLVRGVLADLLQSESGLSRGGA